MWKKLGRIFEPEPSNSFLISHASNPMAVHLNGDIFRVFYCGRDHVNRSSVSFVDVDLNTHQIIRRETTPCLIYGTPDSFYSHGVSIGNPFEVNGVNQILFMGWQIPEGGHWRGDIGRIILNNTREMTVYPNHPYMTVDEEDPISFSYPWVMYDEGMYRMWYGSTISWDSDNGEMIHVIKSATSTDGENWQKNGVAIPWKLGEAQAFSRPTVIRNADGYHCWFSYRSGSGETYRIGYAKSKDAVKWELALDEAGITVSETGWDSEMICYPFVFQHHEKLYMLYNGNGYGKTGFGLAEFIPEKH